MRARRDELVPHGYVIRKLNQAYFALYGSYGGGFAASPAIRFPACCASCASAAARWPSSSSRCATSRRVAELRAAVGLSPPRQPHRFARVPGQQHAQQQAEQAFAIAAQGHEASPEFTDGLADDGAPPWSAVA